MKEIPERPAKKHPLSAEDRYVGEVQNGFSRDLGIPDLEMPTDERLREEYRAVAEQIRSKERKQLQTLQQLLTPVVKHYVQKAEESLASGELEGMKWRSPTLAPNFETLVDIIDEKDVLREGDKLEHAIPEELKRYGKDSLEVIDVARHITLNAADLTETNLALGGSRTERTVDELLKENFGAPPHDTKRRAHFFQTLGLSRVKEVLWGEAYPDSVVTLGAFHEYEVLPIGQYGEKFSRRLFTAMQMMLTASLPMKDAAEKLAKDNLDVFHRTARGRDMLRENVRYGASHSLQEGILSLFQAIYLLTAEKISGYEDPDTLLRDIVEAQLPNQLAHTTPAGTIGPLSLMGRYIPGLVQKTEAGQLILNPDVKKIFLERKKENLTEKVRSSLHIENYEPPLPAAGRGCPVSFESKMFMTSGINQLSQLLLDMYKHTKS